MNSITILAHMQSVVGLGTKAATALWQRVSSLPGFGFRETMTGTIRLKDAGKRKIVFHLRAAVPQLVSYMRDGRTAVIGDISIEGLCRGAEVVGGLWIWPQHRIIRYELAFHDEAGRRYCLAGQKDIRLLAFRRTMTTLPAELMGEAGEPLGHAEVHFAIADLPAFVRSFHTVHGDLDEAMPAPAVASI
jgi:hypothetical protein